MNSKILLTLLLFGIVISVSVVSAATITDNGVDTNDGSLRFINLEDIYHPYLDKNADDVPIFIITDDNHPSYEKIPDLKG